MRRERLAIVGVVVLAVLAGLLGLSGTLYRSSAALVGNFAGIEVPPLDDPAMIRRGAAHYDRVCARCHASPDRPDRADTLNLSPPPPKLHQRVDGWPPEMLFRTIKRGVPGTGMPAWPVEHRDDEVWSMVAFLRVLPGLDAATYRELAGVTAESMAPPLSICARCHGSDGRGSPDGAFPRLDIQSPAYIYATLRAFRDGRRASGFMQSAVSGLRDDELAALANHYGREAGASTSGRTSMPTAPGAADRKIPACVACHGPPHPARQEFPSLAGQYESYLLAQLRMFAGEAPRGGGPFVNLMERAAHFLSDAEIRAYAEWYASH